MLIDFMLRNVCLCNVEIIEILPEFRSTHDKLLAHDKWLAQDKQAKVIKRRKQIGLAATRLKNGRKLNLVHLVPSHWNKTVINLGDQ